MKKWNTGTIRALKGQKPIPCLTACDFASATIADAAGIPLLLVGDSLGNTVLGYKSTLPVTLDQMLHHTAAVVRGTTSAMVVADMPFMSYQISTEEALRNAGRFLKEAGADAVKIEGGTIRTELVQLLTTNGIPVMGHIGLTPQSINTLGGYKVQGRNRSEYDQLLEDAVALAEAGAFSIVVECVPPELGAAITAAIPIPVIGIGAGPACDGQVLVLHDILGMTNSPPRFVKVYANLAQEMKSAFENYIADVESGSFPAAEHCYTSITPNSDKLKQA